jgi:hypothetical protein
VHQTITVEHKHSSNDEHIIELARRLAREVGVEESRLIGFNRMAATVDAEFTEVQDAASSSNSAAESGT